MIVNIMKLDDVLRSNFVIACEVITYNILLTKSNMINLEFSVKS